METTAEISVSTSAEPIPPTSATTTVTRDPLLKLLRRYETELAAFDHATGSDRTAEEDDQIAEETWYSTNSSRPRPRQPGTVGLDHVLTDDDLAAERSENDDKQMLWLLVKAARDYVAAIDRRWTSDAIGQPLDS